MYLKGNALEINGHLLGKLALFQALLEAQQFAKPIKLELSMLDGDAVTRHRHSDL